MYRKATQEQIEGVPRDSEDQGCVEGQEEINVRMEMWIGENGERCW
jgi:hypothetical protein